MKIQNRHASIRLPESASLLLDLIRLSAAVLVVVAHLTHPEFRLGYADQQILGDIAVPIFFVLSGFVIRYVTHTRESQRNEYFIDRASRIYSVVLPAMLFTLAVSGICFLIDRPQFLRDWSSTFDHPVVRLVFNLIFISQAWGHNTIPFVNSPFWSLGYECIYYLLYGFLFFFGGWRRVFLCAAVGVAIGPQVIFLFPVWWLGCWVYDLYVRYRRSRVAAVALISSAVWLVVSAAFFEAGHSGLLLMPMKAFQAVAGVRNPLESLGVPAMRATMFAVAVGLLSSVTLLLLLFAMDYIEVSSASWSARGFRRLANGTFTIYLMHYPFLVLLLFAKVLRPRHLLNTVLVGCVLCSVLIAAAVPIDALKLVLRRWLRRAVA